MGNPVTSRSISGTIANTWSPMAACSSPICCLVGQTFC
jgi:hypothetical protein